MKFYFICAISLKLSHDTLHTEQVYRILYNIMYKDQQFNNKVQRFCFKGKWSVQTVWTSDLEAVSFVMVYGRTVYYAG